MALRFVVLCVVIASVKAGVLHSALRVETPIVATAPASVRYEIPPTSKVEHLAPVVSTSYGYSTFPLKHEVVAPAVKIAAPAPAVHVETPAIHVQAPTVHVETPAITRVEHLAPAVASSYRTEVINPPQVHITHTPAVAKIKHVPTIAKIEHVPTIAKIEHLPTIAKIEHVPAVHVETPAIHVQAPTVHVETPAITRVEHLEPAVASSYRTEVINPPKVHITHTPAVAKIEHVPTIAKIEHVPTIAKIEHVPTIAKIEHVPTFAKIEHVPTYAKFEHSLPAVRNELYYAPAAQVSIAQPALRFETPAITKVEHLTPLVSSFTKTLSAPAVRYETHHLPLVKYETPAVATVEHLAKTGFIAEPSLRVASFDHSLHGLSLSHLGHHLVY